MKTKLLTILLLLLTFNAGAQVNYIEVNEIYQKTSNYNFGSEWQYLTTDMYLMNANTLDKLLQNTFPPYTIKNSLKSVFISAKLQGSILEGLEYPLYNFMKGTNNRMEVVDNYEAVTILKNMPLSGNDNISAKISVEAVYSAKTINTFVNNVMEKVNIISKFTSLTSAVGALKDELTKISANSDKKYIFNSTIQIYRDFNPDRKVYSIAVYMFHNRGFNYNVQNSGINFDGILNSGSDYVNNSSLQAAMQDKDLPYPYLIVVNYKSKYVSELDTKAEITSKVVMEREKSIESKKESKEINSEIFAHEKHLNEFLNKYAVFYESVANEYKYNKNAEVVAKIISQYRDLCATKDIALKNYSSNGLFTSCFQKHYEDVVNKADIELSYHPELEKAKSTPIVGTLSDDKSTVTIVQNQTSVTGDNNKDDNDDNQPEPSEAELDKKIVDAKFNAKKVVRNARSCINAITNCGFSLNDENLKEDLHELNDKKDKLNAKKDELDITDKQAYINALNILAYEVGSLTDDVSKSFNKIKEDHDKEIAAAQERERLEQERIAQEQARIAAEKAEQERIAKEKAEQERLEQERKAREAAEQARAEEERIAREAEVKRLEQERLAREAEEKRLEEERIAREAEQKRIEEERIAAEKAEKERLENLKYRVVFKDDLLMKEITMTDYEEENFIVPKSFKNREYSNFEWNTRRDGRGESYAPGSFWEYDKDDAISEYFDDADEDRESRTITLYPIYHDYGVLEINHYSDNLYYIYVDDKYSGKMSGRGTYTINLSTGTHNIYVVQQSGYISTPTRGTRTVTIEWGKTTSLSGPVDRFSNSYFR